MPIFQNLTLPSLARISRHGFLDLAKEFEADTALCDTLRPARLQPLAGSRHALRRQPAEGRHRQVARHRSQGHHTRRTNQGHRRRLEIRRPRLHERTREPGPFRHHGLFGNSRNPRHGRPHHRHARGPDRRNVQPRRRRRRNPGPLRHRQYDEGGRVMAAFLKSRDVMLAGVILLLLVGIGIINPRFVQPENLVEVFNDSSILIMVALAQMLVILTKCIDLSVSRQYRAHRHDRGDAEFLLSRRSRWSR